MANTLSGAEEQLLVGGLRELRRMLLPMPMVATYMYDPIPDGKESVVDIPVPVPFGEPYDVTPGHNPFEAPAYRVVNRKIPVDQWKGQSFALTSKELSSVGPRAYPLAAKGALISIADYIVRYFLRVAHDASYVTYGDAANVPFDSTNGTRSANQVMKLLEDNLTPTMEGNLVYCLSTGAKAEAKELRAFQDTSWRGNSDLMDTGMFYSGLGFNYYCPQVLPTHTVGTGSGYLVNSTTHAKGDTQVPLDTGTGTLLKGDKFTVAGDSQPYVVRAFSGGILTYAPEARVQFADNAAITVLNSGSTYRGNMAFHPQAICFVTRPELISIDPETEPYVRVGQARDELTGLVLTLEITRQYKQTMYEFSTIFGIEAQRFEWIATHLENVS